MSTNQALNCPQRKKMAALLKLLVTFVAFCTACASSDIFSGDFEDVHSCQDICNKRTVQSDGNRDLAECCSRGCRLFSIVSFIHDHSDLSATIADCAANCGEAYSNSTEREACQFGCHNQKHASIMPAEEEFHQRRIPEEEEEPVEMSMLYPLLYMHSMYSNMLDKVHSHMEVSWSFFTQAENGELVVVRSPPHVIEFVAAHVEDMGDNVPWADDKTSPYLETNIVGQDNSATPLLNFRVSQMRAAHGVDNADDGLQLDVEDRARRADWLTCVAKKTGIARIVLCVLILATAAVMIWFCLSAATTAPEQHLSISGDLEYLRIMGEKDSFKLLHPQDRVEARPLPIKIRVEQI